MPFCKEYVDTQPEVTIHITWDWEKARHPSTPVIGTDLLQDYYKEEEFWFCEAKGGKAPVTCTCYRDDFSWMECAINEKTFLEPPDTLDNIIRLLPMRAIFTHFQTLFLHASQVSINGTGIVFAASSGSGKTTQARLWKQYAGAEIICNDRTLVRQNQGIWKTYGYPIDGSEPVRSEKVNCLGCIILLKKGKENKMSRLRVGLASALLMEQAVIDCWNAEDRESILKLLLKIQESVPVYQLVCTPDVRAVDLVKEKLMQEGVITYGADS